MLFANTDFSEYNTFHPCLFKLYINKINILVHALIFFLFNSKALSETTTIPVLPVSLGKPCFVSAQCKAKDPYSECINGMCECLKPTSECSSSHTSKYHHIY